MDYFMLFVMILLVIMLFWVVISDSVDIKRWRKEKEEIFDCLRANENMLKERNYFFFKELSILKNRINDLILKDISTLKNRIAETEKKYNHIVNDLSGSLKQYAEELIKDANDLQNSLINQYESEKMKCNNLNFKIKELQDEFSNLKIYYLQNQEKKEVILLKRILKNANDIIAYDDEQGILDRKNVGEIVGMLKQRLEEVKQ